MKKKPNAAVGVIAVIILVIIGASYGTYFYWTGRGDFVDFSASGNYGWGTRAISGKTKAGMAHVADYHNYLFVRDLHYLQKQGGGAPKAP